MIASSRKLDNTIRIIGGQWRGRKISFASEKGLRPTLDRVRETLFNWLQADINQANCLDLFNLDKYIIKGGKLHVFY